MDWGFTKVVDYDGSEYNVACFAMVCHHCGQQYIEFFPNAKQENLFIGMLHAFGYMGIPKYESGAAGRLREPTQERHSAF